ncbi:TetR/AcrR family transcriptional regulator [Paenibacillus sp. OV219]|uniref:TetR/AcrR family transcriptional regulator n=1 Tax=Paenibacillus sp. OV219 TaxID=1884377 RepID=UPI0008AB1EC2|nr:TetR/AcrR family transcriptional regulator [Paenibacillus sp. OV219]SEN51288.1 transcriptional regulator, TetR family [Paenibacillus sp. OV219]
MTDKMDRRQAKTKQALRKALMDLIEENGIEGLTVTDISARADVNRGTFYLHYRDAQDMLSQIKSEILEAVDQLMQQVDIYELRQFAVKEEPYPAMLRMIEELARNGDFLKIILGPKGDPAFAISLKAMITKHIWGKMLNRQAIKELLVPAEYLLAYTTSANFGILTHWIESGMKQTPTEVAHIMMRIHYHGPVHVLNLD